MAVEEGAPAPGFTLESDEGQRISLSDYQGKRWVVLFFFPKASTPG